MFRLIGFLIGSLTSILIILLIVGMPKFHLGEEKTNRDRYDAALENLRARQQEIEEDVARVAETVENGIEQIVSEEPLAPAAEETVADITAEKTDNADQPVTEEPDALPIEVDANWYSFWNPFRSEIAANGFVSQLEKVTGIDYRVVKVKTGVYEVAFAYQDDAERRTKLSQIAMATGLELPDS